MTQDRDNVLSKARKLLRLKERAGTTAEALAAARALAKLLDKHRIEVTELELSAVQQPESFVANKDEPLYEYRRVTTWRRELGFALCKHFGVALWQRTAVYHGERSSDHSMCMCGRPSDIELVRAMYDWLTSEIEALAVSACAGMGRGYANSWRRGFAHGVHKQLEDLRSELSEAHAGAMILYGREEAAKSYLDALLAPKKPGEMKPAIIRWRDRSSIDQYGFASGFVRGQSHHLGEHLDAAEPEPQLLDD